MGKATKYKDAMKKLDELTDESKRRTNSKAGLTITDLVYQIVSRPTSGNNFWRVMLFWSIVLLAIAITITLLELLIFK